MEITVTDASPSLKLVKVTFSAEEIQKRYDEKLAELRIASPVKGFRPGKAPDHILEKRFGKGILRELKHVFLFEGYQESMKQHTICPLREPEIEEENISLEKGKPCTIEFQVEVLPPFELPKYKEIEIQQPNVRITNKEIDLALEHFRRQRGEWVYVENSECGEGDQIVCDVNLKVQDKLVWGKQNFSLIVQDFEIMGILIGKKLFLGKKAGDVCSKSTKLPADFRIEEYKDQDAEVSFAIAEIKKVRLPELDDEFARAMGAADLPDLKNRLRNDLKVSKEIDLRHQVEREIVNYLVRDTKLDLPEEFVNSRVARMTESVKLQMRKEGKSEAKIKSQIEKQEVARQLKEYFIIERISQIEHIEATDEEIESQIAAIAQQEQRWPNEVREEFEQKGAMEELKFQVKTRKVLNFLYENAKMTASQDE